MVLVVSVDRLGSPAAATGGPGGHDRDHGRVSHNLILLSPNYTPPREAESLWAGTRRVGVTQVALSHWNEREQSWHGGHG